MVGEFVGDGGGMGYLRRRYNVLRTESKSKARNVTLTRALGG